MATKPVPPRAGAAPLSRRRRRSTSPRSLRPQLPELLAAADVAAVLVRLRESDPRSMISTVKALAPAIQNAGAALLDRRPSRHRGPRRRRWRASERHCRDGRGDALAEARPHRRRRRARDAPRSDGGGRSRRRLRAVRRARCQGQRPSLEAIAERLEWWDELFEPPCVGFATSREEAEAFAAAGADFVLVGDIIWSDPRGAKAALVEIGEAIAHAHASSVRNGQGRGMTPE